MITMLAGFAVAFGLFWGVKAFANTDPRRLAGLAKKAGGVVLAVAAALIGLRGNWEMALLAGGAAAWLFGWSDGPIWRNARWFGASAAGAGAAAVRIVRDPRDGRIRGTVTGGAFAGRALDSLSAADLEQLHAALSGRDVEGTALLEAYLDGRFPGWREHAHGDAHRRPGMADPQSGAVSEQEAHQILGLQPGAGPEDIRRAHRALIKKLHPDQGGSAYLASRINQAKDLLLHRHR